MRSRSREVLPRSSWPPSRDCARSIETPPIEPNPPPSSPERSAVPASSDCVRDIGTPAIGGGSEVGPLEPPEPLEPAPACLLDGSDEIELLVGAELDEEMDDLGSHEEDVAPDEAFEWPVPPDPCEP